MKRIFVLGVCALFVACSSSTEKTSEADSAGVVSVDTATVAAAADTSSTTAAPVAENPAATQAATAEVKVSEPAPAKVEAVKEAAAPKPAAESVDLKKGEALIAKSDCFACHKVQEKVLGPSYKDVAKKYENTKANIDYLANKIKVGGSGVWGAVPMSPHPALSDDDAKAMVQYILSLN